MNVDMLARNVDVYDKRAHDLPGSPESCRYVEGNMKLVKARRSSLCSEELLRLSSACGTQ